MSLERDGPKPVLVEVVREKLGSAGWEEGDRGFARTLRRVTFRGRLEDFVAVARRDGLPGLDRLLRTEGERLERASTANAFRERRLAAVLPGVVTEILTRRLGGVTVTRVDDLGRPLKPRNPGR